jgi:glycerol-3-phosphate acyltransferase PlsY
VAVISCSLPSVVVAIVLSYALGSIPGAPIVARRYGVDLRRTADGNPGAWNALQQLGWSRAWPAFVIDGLKGTVAAVAGWLTIGAAPWTTGGGVLRAGGAFAGPLPGHWLPWACVGAAMLGHAIPLQRRTSGWRGWGVGRGGKSVMTFAGGAVALVPWAGVPLAAVFVVLALRGRAALGARVAVGAFPLVQALVTPLVQVGWTGVLMTGIGVLFVARRRMPPPPP